MSTRISILKDSSTSLFYGIGGVTSNGMTKLLKEYKEEYRNDILDFLFLPYFGASFHHLKIEIGSDANGTCGTEPSHMRSDKDYDITRGVGLWLGKEAKKRNPSITLDAIRWGTPSWITDNEKKYLYYKSFLQGARDEFGLEFDYLCSDENEGEFNRNWVVKTLRPRLDEDGFNSVKLTGADSTENWNIAPLVKGDIELKNSLFAISRHYQQTSPKEALESGMPIFDSEDIAPFRHSFSFALLMAYKIIKSYASGKMVQYVMHPIIEAIYDNVPYTCKGILVASHPWSGHWQVEPSLWVVAHFTQFTKPGWKYIDSACTVSKSISSLALYDNQKDDYSIIILNMSDKSETVTIDFDFSKVDSLYLWTTSEREQFVQREKCKRENGVFTITLEKKSICTLTTTTGQKKGEPKNIIPSSTSFSLPYFDDFSSYESGKQPLYTVDQSGAFEIVKEGKNGAKCLKQIITKDNKPLDWERRLTPQPYTILGGQELKNYNVSISFQFCEYSFDSDCYILLGARCNYSPSGDLPAECYNTKIYHDGRWELCSASYTIKAGIIESFNPDIWHTVAIECNNDTVKTFLDSVLLTEIKDDEYSSGQIVIGTGYNKVRFSFISIDKAQGNNNAECIRYDDKNPLLLYKGEWKDSGDDAKNYNRTLSVSDEKNAKMSFSFIGDSFSIVGQKGPECGLFDIYKDGKLIETVDTYSDSVRYRKCLFSLYSLEVKEHNIEIVVRGEHSDEAKGSRVVLDCVEVTGGELRDSLLNKDVWNIVSNK